MAMRVDERHKEHLIEHILETVRKTAFTEKRWSAIARDLRDMGLRLPSSRSYNPKKCVELFVEKYMPHLFNANEEAWSQFQAQQPEPTEAVSCPLQDATFRAELREMIGWWQTRERRNVGRSPRVTVTECNPVTPVTDPELHPAVTTAERLNILGWTVRQETNGSYRAFRKIAGKTQALSLGKSLDGAEAKIETHEAQLKAEAEH